MVSDVSGIESYPISTYLDGTNTACGTTDSSDLRYYNGLPSGTPCDVNTVGLMTDHAVAAAPDKPVWMSLQAYGPGGDDPYALLPTYTDLHAMAYSAIIHGANGILWWGLNTQYPVTLNSPIYQNVVSVNHELQSIKPILSSPTAGFKFATGTADLDQIVKNYQGSYYVILLNKKDTSLTYNLNLGSIPGNQVKNMISGSLVNITNGQLTETISAHDVRVYRIQTAATITLALPHAAISASTTGTEAGYSNLSISTGTTVYLAWSSTDATSCNVSPGGFSGTASNSTLYGPLAQTTTFNISCTGPGGTASASTTVTVNAANQISTVVPTYTPTYNPPPVFTPPIPPTNIVTLNPGCNGPSGFSTVTGESCIGNIGNNVTTNPATPYNFGFTTLRLGSTGEPVKELQRFLNHVLNLGLIVDGKLGPKTVLIIKKWQNSNGLLPDGIVGPKTKAQMNYIALYLNN